jgi:hypothetical protein
VQVATGTVIITGPLELTFNNNLMEGPTKALLIFHCTAGPHSLEQDVFQINLYVIATPVSTTRVTAPTAPTALQRSHCAGSNRNGVTITGP